MQKTVLTFLALFFFCLLSAQTERMQQEVLELFEKPKNVEWVQHFRGYFDDFNEVAVTLAYDGKYCKGQLRYLQSKESFWLSGSIKKGVLQLQEVDRQMQTTGFLQGEIQQFPLHLEWKNYNQTIGGNLVLHRNNLQTEQKRSADREQWIRTYRGMVFNKPLELLLQNDGQNGLRGIAYFEEDQRSYQLKGDLLENGRIKLYLRNNHARPRGSIEGILKNNGQISANYYNQEGRRSPSLFSVEEDLPLKCKAYADYISSYDITFPETPHLAFNHWMEQISEEWINNCRQYAHQVKQINYTATPQMRSTIRAYAWSDLELYTDRLMSCFVTFNNTWTYQQEGKAINYDFVKQQEITLEDIFIAEFDHQAFIRQYLNRSIGQHTLYNDYEFRKWLAQQAFPYFTIRKEGLCFSTVFNTVYGQQRIVIPYEQLRPYFKVDNPLKPLY